MLKTIDLSRRYGAFLALDALNLEIGGGELHGFVGPNGAGKTTTMRILATLLPPTGGTAIVDGADVRKNPREVRRKVGYMPDYFGVYSGLKTTEYLDFYGSCYGIPYKERKKMGASLLELVNLENKADAYVDTLSRGMKQRLCLARSLIHDPSLLILDEPASGMDPRARAEMKGILRTLKDMGKTVLISSHILPELSELCDTISILDHGKLIFSGAMDALEKRMAGNAPLMLRVLSEMERAVRLLKEFGGVTGIEQEDEITLRVEFEGDDEKMAALLRALIAQGVPVADFHRATMNLEAVFMEVTENDATA